jgi:hypothetical protein
MIVPLELFYKSRSFQQNCITFVYFLILGPKMAKPTLLSFHGRFKILYRHAIGLLLMQYTGLEHNRTKNK